VCETRSPKPEIRIKRQIRNGKKILPVACSGPTAGIAPDSFLARTVLLGVVRLPFDSISGFWFRISCAFFPQPGRPHHKKKLTVS
jgi:hypothetical protein